MAVVKGRQCLPNREQHFLHEIITIGRIGEGVGGFEKNAHMLSDQLGEQGFALGVVHWKDIKPDHFASVTCLASAPAKVLRRVRFRVSITKEITAMKTDSTIHPPRKSPVNGRIVSDECAMTFPLMPNIGATIKYAE